MYVIFLHQYFLQSHLLLKQCLQWYRYHHPKTQDQHSQSLTKQRIALLKTENIELEFSDDGIDTIANIASEVNTTVENIGARRLHTIIEKILDEISFTATDRAGEKIVINKEYINKNLDDLVKDTDLSKFIL